MTLQEELKKKWNRGKMMKPVKSAEEIWEYISQGFKSITPIELKTGTIACVEVERRDRELVLSNYTLDDNFNERNIKISIIEIDEEFIVNFKEMMEKVVRRAEMEGCNVEYIKEEDYQGWSFEVRFK